MKLSTKSTYGLRAMLRLAVRHGSGVTPISEISGKEEISTSYLEQLFNSLRRSGLVRSVRGAKGGYVLSKEPGKISVGEIVRALEKEVYTVYCVGRNNTTACKMSRNCATKVVWQRLQDAIDRVLDTTSLGDLAGYAEHPMHANAKERDIHEKRLSGQ